MKDLNYASTIAAPSAAGNSNFATWDLGARLASTVGGGGDEIPGRHVELVITTPAIAALADTKNLTFVLNHCDTSGGTYTDSGVRYVLTGAGGAGVAAARARLRLHPGTKRYLKLNVALDSAGGSITGSNLTAELDFVY